MKIVYLKLNKYGIYFKNDNSVYLENVSSYKGINRI